ncbi:GNAT family N-acetyltransferase [Micromonospora sp. FIMYZ51]|uniref:GNAT family N-acetyltransferase n=1 Tax=Micromonospora sp. FIMYZ51 TaxID=3051832 RepID=UPI00311F5708
MEQLTVRDRDGSDLPACVEMLAEVHRSDSYPLNWPVEPYRWLSPPGLRHAWVAEADDAGLVGHLALHQVPATGDDQERAEVSRLFVAPAFRRHRVGIALLAQARRWATEHRIELILEVVDDRRSPAVALYERDGWQHTATETADWTAPDGSPVTLRRYALPPGGQVAR